MSWNKVSLVPTPAVEIYTVAFAAYASVQVIGAGQILWMNLGRYKTFVFISSTIANLAILGAVAALLARNYHDQKNVNFLKGANAFSCTLSIFRMAYPVAAGRRVFSLLETRFARYTLLVPVVAAFGAAVTSIAVNINRLEITPMKLQLYTGML
ncbi:hypothetical protein PhCBS80983_g05979 [Powellomyces hirtus]|uniref:Uncharacterized protein n=1 Tax=Powellomyces hirtus TaxID=109895 RepID=A0A507DRG6_9FUNG|nr:hypothetical protein PhCBS80983_g05979 [Powellomyces hirtus]